MNSEYNHNRYCTLCKEYQIWSENQFFCNTCTSNILAAETEKAELEEKVRALETHIAASPGGQLYLEAEKRWNETYHQ